MSEHNANRQLSESKRQPDLMAERKPLDLRDKPKGDKDKPGTWKLEK